MPEGLGMLKAVTGADCLEFFPQVKSLESFGLL
jgi:hypothetical protein